MCSKASKYASKLAQQHMELFHESNSEPKELDRDRERLILLKMKIHTVDGFTVRHESGRLVRKSPLTCYFQGWLGYNMSARACSELPAKSQP